MPSEGQVRLFPHAAGAASGYRCRKRKLAITPPPPMFFISVDSGGFRCAVSCLESTLVGWFVSVAFKRVRAGMVCGGSLPKQEREKRENEKECGTGGHRQR